MSEIEAHQHLYERGIREGYVRGILSAGLAVVGAAATNELDANPFVDAIRALVSTAETYQMQERERLRHNVIEAARAWRQGPLDAGELNTSLMKAVDDLVAFE